MNVLYVIGNGFDLRLGMPTSYSDFLDYYKKQDSSNEIKKYKDDFFLIMNEKEKQGEKDWRNLEFALGQCTESLDNIDNFILFFDDMYFSLMHYLEKLDKKISNSIPLSWKKKLREDLLFPIKYLREKERILFNNDNNFFRINNFKVLLFNYTHTFEYIYNLGDIYEKDAYDNSTIHIHGTLYNNDCLFGVDNELQIKNEKFRLDDSIKNAIVKPIGNETLGKIAPDDAIDIINNSEIICFFGISFGETDKTWWNNIKDKFIIDNFVKLICFIYDEKLNIEKTRKTEIYSKYNKHYKDIIIKDVLGLDPNQADYQNRVFIALNTDMFPKGNKINFSLEKI